MSGRIGARIHACLCGPRRQSERKLNITPPFLVGCIVGYACLQQQLTVTIGAGGYCFVAAALLSMLTRATLERRTVWRAIAPERRALPRLPRLTLRPRKRIIEPRFGATRGHYRGCARALIDGRYLFLLCEKALTRRLSSAR